MNDGKLLSGQSLKPEETLISPNNHAHLHYQKDGNLVVYLDGIPFWASHTEDHSAGQLVMQHDGNLVIYDRRNKPVASTQTHGHPGAMVQLQDDGNFVIYEDPSGPKAGTPIWASSNGKFDIVKPEPEPVTNNRPLVGPLRIENKLFRDDTGYRRVFFCSWFPALRVLRDNPDLFYWQLDEILRAGYQGIRIFIAVGGWSDFWDGREVVPMTFQKWFWTGNFLRSDRYGDIIDSWRDYPVHLEELLDACIARNLRLHITTGDFQIICPDYNKELEFHKKAANICAKKNGTNVIAHLEVTNEFPINRHGSSSKPSIDQMGKVIDIWKNTIPGVLTSQGAIPQNEEPESLRLASTHGNVCVSHTTRSPFPMALKRTFGLVYWEGNYRGFEKPFWQGEPAGPGYDSFDPMNDPAELTALYAMHGLTGQASNQFSGPSVRYLEPLSTYWGFFELPKLFSEHLPEDVATWNHGNNSRGGIEYWWKDKRFVTSTCKEWDPSPPRPIANWTMYSGDVVKTGTGTPPRMVGLLTGNFS